MQLLSLIIILLSFTNTYAEDLSVFSSLVRRVKNSGDKEALYQLVVQQGFTDSIDLNIIDELIGIMKAPPSKITRQEIYFALTFFKSKDRLENEILVQHLSNLEKRMGPTERENIAEWISKFKKDLAHPMDTSKRDDFYFNVCRTIEEEQRTDTKFQKLLLDFTFNIDPTAEFRRPHNGFYYSLLEKLLKMNPTEPVVVEKLIRMLGYLITYEGNPQLSIPVFYKFIPKLVITLITTSLPKNPELKKKLQQLPDEEIKRDIRTALRNKQNKVDILAKYYWEIISLNKQQQEIEEYEQQVNRELAEQESVKKHIEQEAHRELTTRIKEKINKIEEAIKRAYTVLTLSERCGNNKQKLSDQIKILYTNRTNTVDKPN